MMTIIILLMLITRIQLLNLFIYNIAIYSSFNINFNFYAPLLNYCCILFIFKCRQYHQKFCYSTIICGIHLCMLLKILYTFVIYCLFFYSLSSYLIWNHHLLLNVLQPISIVLSLLYSYLLLLLLIFILFLYFVYKPLLLLLLLMMIRWIWYVVTLFVLLLVALQYTLILYLLPMVYLVCFVFSFVSICTAHEIYYIIL